MHAAKRELILRRSRTPATVETSITHDPMDSIAVRVLETDHHPSLHVSLCQDAIARMCMARISGRLRPSLALSFHRPHVSTMYATVPPHQSPSIVQKHVTNSTPPWP